MKLVATVEFARLKEQNDKAMKAVMKPYLSFNRRPFLLDKDSASLQRSNQLSNMYQKTAPSSNLSVSKPIRLTPAERRIKQEKGLCYFCDQPYGRGHVCPIKQTQLFTLEIPGLDEVENINEAEPGDLDEGWTSNEGSLVELNAREPCIFVNALSGHHGCQTMWIIGFYGKTPLHILIDIGSTHNFIDIVIAEKIGLRKETISTQSVTVADGNNLICTAICKGFTWRIKETEFQSDVWLIPLGGCDMVVRFDG